MHNVSLAFHAELARFFHGSFRAILQEVLGAHHFGADEATLQVAVDGSGSDGGGVAHMDGPGSCLVRTGGEEGMQIQGVVGCAHQLVHARLSQPSVFHKESTIVSIKLCDFSLQFTSDDEHVLAFLQGCFHGIGILVSSRSRSVINVADVYQRLGSQQLDVLHVFLVFLGHFSVAGVAEVLQGFFVNREHIKGFLEVLFAVFQQLLHSFQFAGD